MKYFAYGSNMSLLRLRTRVPRAERIGMFTLAQHALRFHKWSRIDQSAKCHALFTGNPEDFVIGALFEIPRSEKGPLDRAERLGFGYDEKRVTVTDPSLLPHSWYLNHVIVGATETGVPADYLDAISATPSQEDPDRERDARERAIYD